MKHLLKVIFSLLILVSCSTSRPLKNYETNPIPTGLSLDSIQTAIIRAGIKRGWVINPKNDKNTFVATLNHRHHTVILDIPYTTSNYALLYQSSVNMNHSAKRNSIHRNYFRWLQYLKLEIDTQLALESTQK